MSLKRRIDAATRRAGFSTLELIFVLLIGTVLTVCAVPIISDVVNSYRLKGAISSATWAIQSTRFQALMSGYPYEVTFQGNSSGYSPTYQIASKPSGQTSYANVGSSVPLSGSDIKLTTATVVQFQPNGTVAVTQGGSTVTSMQVSYGGNSNTITVSNYGNLSVTSP
jgi:Tfp pilus assembly protein FimT